MKKLLENVRILDFSHVFFGPYCTMLLADMGAEVIKIEPPWGEMLRFAPPLVNGASPLFTYFNRGKKSLKLNLKAEKSVKIIKDLIKHSDVVVENFSLGVMDRLGLGYETLKEINPKIIYASLSGYGQNGPYADRPSFDIIAQALSGIMYLTREQFGDEGPPIATADAPGDIVPALFATLSILSALYYRTFTGVGQRIDVAQTDTMISIVSDIMFYTLLGQSPTEVRKKYPIGVYGTFKASDGYVVIGAPHGNVMDRFKKATGIEDTERKVVEEWVKSRSVDEVVTRLVEGGVPVAPVLTVDKTVADPHVQAREMIVEVDYPQAGKCKMPNFPVKFSGTPVKVERPSPILGEHNEEILTRLLSYRKEDVVKLKEEGVF